MSDQPANNSGSMFEDIIREYEGDLPDRVRRTQDSYEASIVQALKLAGIAEKTQVEWPGGDDMADRLTQDAELIWHAFGEGEQIEAATALDRLVAEVREHRATLERVRALIKGADTFVPGDGTVLTDDLRQALGDR